jgi:hypothetical protein
MAMPIDSEDIYNKFVKGQLPCDFEDSITPGPAVPIFQGNGSIDFFRIPLNADGRVVGMIDVSSAGSVQRFGLQVTVRSKISSRPQDILELTPTEIESLAASVADPHTVAASDPRLTSLGGARLVWHVMMEDPQTHQQVGVDVTPGFAFLATTGTPGNE